MPLDDQYSELRVLNINEHNTETLHVNQEKWQEQLYRYERKANIGCGFLFLFFFIIPYFISIKYGVLGFAYIFLAFGYKITNTKKANNLKIHGMYKYEFSHDKIVRYSNSNYDIFRFDELKEIRVKPYGMILRKEKTFLDYLGMSVFRSKRKSQLIIPRQLYAYDQVKSFIKRQISGLSQKSTPSK